MLNPRRALLGVTALLLAVGVRHAAAAETWSGKVVAVADGDTITVLRDKTEVKIRLHGVDAPEKAQSFGEQAKQQTSSLVFGKEVRVEVVTRDKYGRTVGRVLYRAGKGGAERCLNEDLLAAGLAWWYRQYSPNDRKLAQLEEEAKRAKRGLWADAAATPPWEYRHPDLVCRRDADCVFLPSICPDCAPCRPTPRRFGNQEALGRIHSMQARVRCALPKCSPCADEKNRVGGKLACMDGRCALSRAPAAAPSPAVMTASGPYHGNVRSKVLHGPGCADYACKKCTAGFKTVDDAKKAGYRPHACAVAFEKCHGECLKRNMAKAVAWEAVEAECRQSCTK